MCLPYAKKDSSFPSSRFIRIYIFSVFGNLRIPTRDKCDTELFNKWSALWVSLMWSNFCSRQHQGFILLVSFTRLPCRIKCFPEFSVILEHGARCNRDKWYFFLLCLTSKMTHKLRILHLFNHKLYFYCW